MNDLSPEARELLRAARSFDEPSAEDAKRVHASVLAKVGVAVGAGAAMTAATSSIAASPAAVLGAAVVKIGAAVIVAGGLATAGYVALRYPRQAPVQAPIAAATAPRVATDPSESVTQAPAITATAPNEIAPRIAEPPTPPPAKARTRSPAASAAERSARPTRVTSDLEGEARLLEQADADLRRGDANAALAQLAEHAARYPDGALREEREGVRVVALCRAGRESEGKKAAERFLARSPRSALATRIRAACGGE